jgi:hypothetical protein
VCVCVCVCARVCVHIARGVHTGRGAPDREAVCHVVSVAARYSPHGCSVRLPACAACCSMQAACCALECAYKKQWLQASGVASGIACTSTVPHARCVVPTCPVRCWLQHVATWDAAACTIAMQELPGTCRMSVHGWAPVIDAGRCTAGRCTAALRCLLSSCRHQILLQIGVVVVVVPAPTQCSPFARVMVGYWIADRDTAVCRCTCHSALLAAGR